MFKTNDGQKITKRPQQFEIPAFDGQYNLGDIYSKNFKTIDDISCVDFPEIEDVVKYIKTQINSKKYNFNLRILRYENFSNKPVQVMPAHNDVCTYTFPVVTVLESVSTHKVERLGARLETHHGYYSDQFVASEDLHASVTPAKTIRTFVVIFATAKNLKTEGVKVQWLECPNVKKHVGTGSPIDKVLRLPNPTNSDLLKALYNHPGIFRKHASRFAPKQLVTV